MRLAVAEELLGIVALGGAFDALAQRPDLVDALMGMLDDMPVELAGDVRQLHDAQVVAAETGATIVIRPFSRKVA